MPDALHGRTRGGRWLRAESARRLIAESARRLIAESELIADCSESNFFLKGRITAFENTPRMPARNRGVTIPRKVC